MSVSPKNKEFRCMSCHVMSITPILLALADWWFWWSGKGPNQLDSQPVWTCCGPFLSPQQWSESFIFLELVKVSYGDVVTCKLPWDYFSSFGGKQERYLRLTSKSIGGRSNMGDAKFLSCWLPLSLQPVLADTNLIVVDVVFVSLVCNRFLFLL